MAKTFTIQDLGLVRSNAIEAYAALPVRCRLPGMTQDLADSDKTIIAYMIAAMQHLNRSGVTKPEDIEALFPSVYTASQEVIEDMACRISQNPKK